MSVDRSFTTVLIAVVWLSAAYVQADEKKRVLTSPVLEQLKPSESSQPAPPTATRNVPPSSGQPAPPTAMQPVPPPGQPAPPTAFRGAGGGGLPDLYVHEYSVMPSPRFALVSKKP